MSAAAALLSEHRRYLNEAAVTDAIIDAAGIYSVSKLDDLPADLATMPTLARAVRDRPLIVFPWTDGKRTIPQVKTWLDDPKYLQPVESGAVLWRHRPSLNGHPHLLVEGSKQSLAAASWAPEGWGVSGMLGHSGWSRQDLSWLADQDVVVTLDADASANSQVWDGGTKLAAELDGVAASVRFLRLKGAGKVGLDDVLAGMDKAERTAWLVEEVQWSGLDLGRRPGEGGAFDGAGEGLTDSLLGAEVGKEVLDGRYRWSKGLGWLRWNGQCWPPVGDEVVIEETRRYVVAGWRRALAQLARSPLDKREAAEKAVAGWKSAQADNRLIAITRVASRIEGIHTEAADFDANPDLSNQPVGAVDLRTGEVSPSDPALLMTEITRGSYRPGYKHPDWEQALTALDPAERDWFQVRVGQAITGHHPPDGACVFLQGTGENGKGVLTTDGLVAALGDYAHMASPKLFSGEKGSSHSTERADLRGRRLVIGEEMTEGRALDVTAIKRIQDVGIITARHLYQRDMTFKASHTLMITTNYVPVVAETDWGTWRRLAMLVFPHTFVKTAEDVKTKTDRLGDPELKQRIAAGLEGQHDAIVTWAVEGAMKWYADRSRSLLPTKKIERDTFAWRKSADRILGLWDEVLWPDRGACVLTEELLSAFNDWLRENGHKAWSKETFTPRFSSHRMTRQRGVWEERTRSLEGVDRWKPLGSFSSPRTLKTKESVWRGVRFRRDSDDPESASDQQEHDEEMIFRPEWPDPLGASLRKPARREVPETSGHSGRKINNEDQLEAEADPLDDPDACPECGDRHPPGQPCEAGP